MRARPPSHRPSNPTLPAAHREQEGVITGLLEVGGLPPVNVLHAPHALVKLRGGEEGQERGRQ